MFHWVVPCKILACLFWLPAWKHVAPLSQILWAALCFSLCFFSLDHRFSSIEFPAYLLPFYFWNIMKEICFISGVNVSFNTYMYTITDSGMTLSFHLSLKGVLIYNKNKSLVVRQLGLAVSYQELNNVWWSWLSRILQATPLQETELLSCEDFKTDSVQSSSNTCKNYLLKIYSQQGNFLNAI